MMNPIICPKCDVPCDNSSRSGPQCLSCLIFYHQCDDHVEEGPSYECHACMYRIYQSCHKHDEDEFKKRCELYK